MRKILYYLVPSAVILTMGYTNCSDALHVGAQSNSSLSGNGTCDDILLNQYKTTVYPFFRSESTCIHCHIEGGAGLGTFSSNDISRSFASFSAAGLSTVAYMATNPQHKPPYTGDQNKPAVDTLSAKWIQYENEHLQCVSKSENGGVNESLLTSAKTATAIYATNGASQTLSWNLDFAADLDESMTRALPAKISVDVKVLYTTVGGVSVGSGYIFSNPTLQMHDGTKEVVVEGLFFQINGVLISSQTTFTNLSRVVSGTLAIPLMNNAQANTLISPISTHDTFQLYVRRIVLASGTDNAPPPLTPILRVSDTTTGSNTLLRSTTPNIAILRDSGIVRWCLSESPTKPASTEAVCQNTLTGPDIVNGWQVSRPSTFRLNLGDGSKTIYLWVADQNLKINDLPGQVTLNLDTAPPAAPTIASISVTDTQVAAMNVTHPNAADVAGWCVIEQNTIQAAPGTPGIGDACWRWTDGNTKPTTVGFKSGGVRNVWVYARDLAGNVSAPSNTYSATNPFGSITFSQLVSTSGDAKAIFNNRCFTCHSTSSNPGYSKLQLFSYSAAVGVANSGILVSRINNALSPMPNIANGLMPQRDRDLVRLWTMPDPSVSNTPLP